MLMKICYCRMDFQVLCNNRKDHIIILLQLLEIKKKGLNYALECAEEKRDEYLKRLRIKLTKADDENEDLIKINKIVSVISKFLKNETSFETNQ